MNGENRKKVLNHFTLVNMGGRYFYIFIAISLTYLQQFSQKRTNHPNQ